MIEKLIEIDQRLLISINQLGTEKWDNFWFTITETKSWIPFFILLIYLVFSEFEKKEAWKIIAFGGLTIITTALLTAGMKEWIQRLRPIHQEELQSYLRIIISEQGYSFFSGHTCNSFGISTFLYLVFRHRFKWAFLIYIWAIPFAFSRLYLGAHFPIDILAGLLVAVSVAYGWHYGYEKNKKLL